VGKKKKIARIVDAVGYLLASAPKKKKLRKAKAFDEFLEQLRVRHAELGAERETLGTSDPQGAALTADLILLEEQIAKAERLARKLHAEDEEES
jgi:hypothetical protein